MIRFDANTSSLVSIHADQNIIFHSLVSGEPSRQIVGFNDEIIDATFLSSAGSSSHTHLALATNSNLIRMYSTSTFDVRLLSGHKDMVLSLDKSIDYRWLASGSKDRTARIWSSTENGDWRCLAVCEGHAEAVGAVALSRKMDDKGKTGRFLMTASQDRTIKMWDLTSIPLDEIPEEPIKPRSLATLRAHEKDINALDLAPNDRFLASGSQDKLVKIYEVDFNPGQGGAVRHVGTCKGHKRGVWTVKFSKTDRIVASGAADRTVRIWSLDDYSCLKVLQPGWPVLTFRHSKGIQTRFCVLTSCLLECSSLLQLPTVLSSFGISKTKNVSRHSTTTRTRSVQFITTIESR
jgi:U3 small nucleolar RNA-associated protein 13